MTHYKTYLNINEKHNSGTVLLYPKMIVQLYIIHFLLTIQVYFRMQPGDSGDNFILYKSQKKCVGSS